MDPKIMLTAAAVSSFSFALASFLATVKLGVPINTALQIATLVFLGVTSGIVALGNAIEELRRK